MIPQDHETRLTRARRSLEGLATGDAFGECFFHFPDRNPLDVIDARVMPAPPWTWTDDTAMALGILFTLEKKGTIDQDFLASTFARNYLRDPGRGYGPMAHKILGSICHGMSWQHASTSAFGGKGSYGNGGAMRAGPLGAYFSGDPVDVIVAQARASAEVTHAHPEGQAGAIAVALAAAHVANGGVDLLGFAIDHTPESETREGLRRAAALPPGSDVRLAASHLGSGSKVSAQDTVPFALWCAARHTDDYVEALWETVEGLGDRDTTCAIVGGIVGLRAEVPEAWRSARESLARTTA